MLQSGIKLKDLRSWYESNERSINWIESMSFSESNALIDRVESCSLPIRTRIGIVVLIKYYRRQLIKIAA